MTEPFVQLKFEALPEKPRVPHPFFEAEERRVPVWTEALGDTVASVRVMGSGPPLMLVHGLMTTGYTFRYVMEPLARDFTVYVPDLPGGGRTEAPDRPLTPFALADWLDTLQQALRIQGCPVIGNSMGGYLCMWWALRHPRSIERLVVVHAPTYPMRKLYALWPVIRMPGARRLLRRLVQADTERWAHRNVHYYDETLKSREETREYGGHLKTEAGLAGFHAQLRDAMDVRRVRELWKHLASRHEDGCDFPMPLQLIYARNDPMVPGWVGRALAERLPAAELVYLEHASHFAHVDNPDLFLPPVRRFLGAPA